MTIEKTGLAKFKDVHKGKRLFLIGNGPSLSETPLNKLNNEYSMALNNIHNIYSDTSWRPDFYFYPPNTCPTEAGVLEDFMKTIDLGIPCFINEDHKEVFPNKDNIHFINIDWGLSTDKLKKIVDDGDIDDIWQTDVTKVLFRPNTSLYVCFQFASYMGFDEIYLLGCDLYRVYEPWIIFNNGEHPEEQMATFEHQSKTEFLSQYYKTSNNKLRSLINLFSWYFALQVVGKQNIEQILSRKSIRNFLGIESHHFYDDFRLHSREKNYKNELTHRAVRQAGNKHGFEVYNATLGGYLEAHPRVSLKKIL